MFDAALARYRKPPAALKDEPQSGGRTWHERNRHDRNVSALARSSGRKPADVPPAPRVEIAAKKRKSGKPAPRVSKHKNRAAWFRSRVTWPMREASRAARVAERRRASRTLARGTLVSDWAQAGPSNIGGRATSVMWIRPTPTACGSARRAAACGEAPTPARRGR